jgi:hypothetical protein
MAWTNRIGLVLDQQVQVLIAEIKSQYLEVECPRFSDLLQADQIAIETPAAFDVGDENRDMVEMRDL